MEYPTLNVTEKSRQMIDTFLGYNHNIRIGENEFYDMENMTSDYYPVLSPRKQRGVFGSDTHVLSMIAKDSLCYVNGSEFVMFDEYNNIERFDIGLNSQENHWMVSLGANIIFLPDRKYFNTKTKEHGDIEAHVTTSGKVSFDLCTVDGAKYENATVSATEPEKTEGKLWIDTSSTPHTLKKYSTSNAMWVSIATTYVKITCEGSKIGETFSQYDGVTISGITANGVEHLNSDVTIQSAAGDSIVVTGIIDQATSQDTPICISRWMPQFSFLIESKNRLWGAVYDSTYRGYRYNTETGRTESASSDAPVNEIRACKLGDFKNWNSFMGLSTDSYAVSVGTDGNFTGAANHLGYPCFFKENCLHKVYGDYPANYRVQDTTCRGVQPGCERSLAIVNEVLFYKSRDGICAYDGSLPELISNQLGNKRYYAAVAGAHGDKYYISMTDQDSQKEELFVYDTSKGVWHKEDNFSVEVFASFEGELYAVGSDMKIVTMFGSGTMDNKPVQWMVETGEIGLSSPDMKYISRLNVRMSLPIGSTVEFYIQYDQADEWEHLFTMSGTSLRTFSVPIRPKRCDHMKLKIEGVGDAKIYSITKTIEQGSELP